MKKGGRVQEEGGGGRSPPLQITSKHPIDQQGRAAFCPCSVKYGEMWRPLSECKTSWQSQPALPPGHCLENSWSCLRAGSG